VGAHPHTRFVVDEAFLPFLDSEAEHSLVPATARLPNLLVLRSMTKLYALPGLRLGYVVAGEGLARRVRTQRVPWSVNVLAQAAGVAALEDDSFLRQTRAWLRAELPSLAGRLRDLPSWIDPLPSRANFVLIRLQGITAPDLTHRLAARGIAVRDASNFVGLGGHYVRVAVRSAGDNRRLVDELVSLFGEGLAVKQGVKAEESRRWFALS
jgi:threonine-phosphate decarboxylase